MLILFVFLKLIPKRWEPSTIWYLAGVELLFFDTAILSMIFLALKGAGL